ncbi:anillin-like isoform X2 [Ochlerotatus camptorhynchus]|uniref:anillin-like isoform X2 n=1 Tax=Ochlerotatus camptorhynchus TaxID=644619 RepID=UPI0031E1FE63
MDPFTQNILERAEKRAAALGITNTSKFPLSQLNYDIPSTSSSSVVPKSPGKKATAGAGTYTKTPKKNSTATDRSPSRPKETPNVTRVETQRKSSSGSGKDVDVAVEINITTASNVQVEVEVAECEIDSNGKITRKVEDKSREADVKSLIRDSSRNQLQRMGTLYSESQDLSSPVHRTEGKFHEEYPVGKENSRPKQKLAKLAMLADTINNWEDDTSHPDIRHHRETVHTSKKEKSPVRQKSPVQERSPKRKENFPKLVGTTPKKYPAPIAPKSILSPAKGSETDGGKAGTKTLKWDQKVMDALELQGFQRRESTTSKLVYEYRERSKQEKQETESNEKALVPIKKYRAPEVPGADSRERQVVPKELTKLPAKKPEISKGLVSGRAAIFESSKSRQSILRNQKDPAEMSLKERLAIFEKNKGQALVPIAAFGTSPSIRQITGDNSCAPKPSSSCLPIQGAGFGIIPKDSTVYQKQKIDAYNKPPTTESNATGMAIKNTLAALMSNNSTISESQIAEETRRQRQQEMSMLLNRFTKPTDAAEQKPIPCAPPMPPEGYLTLSAKKPSQRDSAGNKRRSGEEHVSPEVRCALDDVKRIRVVAPKDGRLYPTLSDIENATTTESEDGEGYVTATLAMGEEAERNDSHYQDCYGEEQQEYEDEEEHPVDEDGDSYMYSDEEESDSDAKNICDVSLGREIMQAVKLQDRHASHGGRRQSQDRRKKSSISSNSFSYQKNPRQNQWQTINEEETEEKKDSQKPSPPTQKQQQQQQQQRTVDEGFSSPVKSELKINPSDDNNMVTLVHTVSFYRRQQNSNNPTPVKKTLRTPVHTRPSVDSTTEDSDDGNSCATATDSENEYLVQEKIKKLLDEVCKQQTIISQTSQALNLCAATIEFSGSTESVEGERHLLVATHRRQAILDEVQRLRVEGCIRLPGAPTEKGRLTVKDITLPLKQDYIRKLASDTISGHHLVCLLKYNDTVLATQSVPTLPGLLSVRFPDVLQLANVYADFKITMEIYGMTAQREVLPHEIKYHIAMNKKGSSKLHTPKGVKSNSRLIMPPVQSPAGPHAVRTPALVQYGFIIFSLREIQRTNWTLNPVSGVSPLEGTVHMKVNCELTVTVDHRGFLTMFEDVSGFGAWHRRWCRLYGHVLSYWKYPDDEKRKAPIGSIDLQNCCTQKVSVAPRDVCARLNTLLLEFRRAAQPDDVDSLVLVRQGNTTIQRHLLSADTKEEREEWCAHLNKTLALLKAWGHSNNRTTSC